MRQLCAYDANDANESTRRLIEDGMSTVLTNTHTALSRQFMTRRLLQEKYPQQNSIKR